ncbi:hypothetical protein BV22DRAFT_1038171 [Leucogyrophana mollusca]|uniref:Uncharacterized protein n=1 Tax=Leucogyrophana mollusca TaxID=85980 RepID=A0ACB8B9E9_9AGAM|nr:hypothetical protein BV22DRAFT_1038171 [Leucogyrophana mollusca]
MERRNRPYGMTVSVGPHRATRTAGTCQENDIGHQALKAKKSLVLSSILHRAVMDSATVIEVARDVMLHSYFGFMANSLLLYDHLITLPGEVTYIWQRPKFASSFLFFLNRYLGLLSNVGATVVSHLPLGSKRCQQFTLVRQLLLVSNQVVICLLLTLRTYALYGCSKRILAFMLGGGLLLGGAACWTLAGQHTYPVDAGNGCLLAYSTTTAIRLAVAWEALFVYDSAMFCLTVFKTYKGGIRQRLFSSEGKVNIVVLIFRDGAIYFAVMAMSNMCNILTYYICPPLTRGILSTFASCISVNLMSRLMLNLHQSADIGIFSTYYPPGGEGDAAVFTTQFDYPSYDRRLTSQAPI